MSFGRALGWLAEQDADAVAVRDSALALTWGQLDGESDRLARAYRDLGVRRDSIVAVGLPNGVEFFLACAGIWKAGAIPSPISPDLPEHERNAVLAVSDPVLLVGLDGPVGGSRPCVPAGWRDDDLPGPLPDLYASSWKAPLSGGSTGRPKVVLSGSPATTDPQRPTASYIPREAVQLVSGPLHHSAPFLFAMRGLLLGHQLVVLPRFDAEAALAAIEAHHVDWALMVPTMMQRIWRLPREVREAYDVSSLQTVLHLGAPCPSWLKRAWIDWLGAEKVMEVYAGTESSGVACIRGDDWLTHPGSVGQAAPGFAFRVLDAEGHDVPAGVTGEIYMRRDRGTGSTYRYLGAAPRGIDGWESLGDVGHLNAEGWLWLTDRSADLVITGGVHVYPAEVEAALDEHPAVRSSAVIGVPHEDLGEALHAIVDTAGIDVPEQDLRSWLTERLVRSKVPRTFELAATPIRDDAGKVRRSALREARLAPAQVLTEGQRIEPTQGTHPSRPAM
jgi:bile acid-coenzyme A ligase